MTQKSRYIPRDWERTRADVKWYTRSKWFEWSLTHIQIQKHKYFQSEYKTETKKTFKERKRQMNEKSVGCLDDCCWAGSGSIACSMTVLIFRWFFIVLFMFFVCLSAFSFIIKSKATKSSLHFYRHHLKHVCRSIFILHIFKFFVWLASILEWKKTKKEWINRSTISYEDHSIRGRKDEKNRLKIKTTSQTLISKCYFVFWYDVCRIQS